MVKIVPHCEIPELIPIDGLRVRISYPQIERLCTGCYEKHLRRDCENEKITWPAYVKKFILENPEIPKELYGSCYGRVMKEYHQKVSSTKPKPVMRDFNLPELQSEWDLMIKKLGECGFDQMKAVSIIKERKCLYSHSNIVFNISPFDVTK